ncbi:MAG TPA: hypothetical protein VGN22_13040 [Pseudonocardia sp.]
MQLLVHWLVLIDDASGVITPGGPGEGRVRPVVRAARSPGRPV